MNSAEILYARAMTDPSVILEAFGKEPDPWQRTFLTDTSTRLHLTASRQSGKSTACSALAVAEIVYEPGADVLLMAPSLRQSRELFIKISDLFESFSPPVQVASRTASSIGLRNGSRVLTIPASERSLRGFSSPRLVILDEASRIPDSVFMALSPVFATGSGRLVAISTPFGRSGWFAQAAEDDSWSHYRVTADEIPRFKPEFLEEARRLMGDQLFEQEYRAAFVDQDDPKNRPIFAGIGDLDSLLDAAFERSTP